MAHDPDEVGGRIRPGEGGEAAAGDPASPPDDERLRPERPPQHVSGALMLSFGAVIPGREAGAADRFTEASRFLGELLADGVLDSFRPFFYDGGAVGDTIGFFLLDGDRERLDELRRREDFRRLLLRVGATTANVRVHPLVAGTEAGRLVNLYRSVREELVREEVGRRG